MNGTINECFIDSSILVEYIKGTQTELLDLLFSSNIDIFINHIVYSEFTFHFLSAMSGVSPLTLKTSSRIEKILKKHKPIEFIRNFKMLSMDDEIIDKSDEFMRNYNLLPNDALILATCNVYNIKFLISYDRDFLNVCEEENIIFIDSPEKFKSLM